MEKLEQAYTELVEKINDYNYHYYTLDKPLISDKQYDLLYDELVVMEENNPEFANPDSPTQRVGGEVLSSLKRKEHTVPMVSLDKAQDFERVIKFVKDTDVDAFTLEWKFDGLAFVARYENGIFVEARTRGNGTFGEVITEQVRTIKSLPMAIPFKDVVEVQGEIVIPLDKFAEYNNEMMRKIKLELLPDESNLESLQNKYKVLSNARNGASGSIRQLDTKIAAQRPLDAFLYNVLYLENKELSSQVEIMDFLKENKFKVGPLFETYKNEKLLEERLEQLSKERATLNFEVDGLVLKVNDVSERDRIGSTSRFPKWAIAYKFEALEEITKLIDVTWEVGRTGRITPRGWVEPVDFDGVVVQKATLNNIDYIKTKGIKIGSDVIIRRSNDVIPQILGVANDYPHSMNVETPKECPSCGSELEKEGPNLFCRNIVGCPVQRVRMLIHFASRDAMDIAGLAEKTIEQLIESRLVESYPDLYRLTKEQLLTLEGFKEKSASNLINATEGSKNKAWPQFLYALGIPNVGRRASAEVVKHFKSWDELTKATFDQLVLVDDFAEKSANKVLEYVTDPLLVSSVEDMFALGVNPVMEEVENEGNAFEGMTFVITGTLSQPRKYYEEIVKGQGGKTSSSVSKNTNYLLAGEKAGSKLKRANELGITVLDEEKFQNLL